MTTDYMTYTDVAQRFGVKPDTVYRWVRSGAMSHIRISAKVIRMTQADIDEFVRSKHQDQAPAQTYAVKVRRSPTRKD